MIMDNATANRMESIDLLTGTIVYRDVEFNVYWRETDHTVWITKVKDPSWGRANYKQWRADHPEEARGQAMEMLIATYG